MAEVNEIINILQKRLPFIEFKLQTIIKNKVPLLGLCMISKHDKEQCISPIVYLDRFLDDNISDEDAADSVIQIFNASGIDIDVSIFQNKDYVLSHLYLAYQQEDNSVSYLHRNTAFENIMEYMYIRDTAADCNLSVKVTEDLLNSLNIPTEVAWKTATTHTASEINIESIAQTLSNITPEMDTKEIESFPLFVMSNSLRINGASVIANKDYIKHWAEERGIEELVIIFSSIHEALLLPSSHVDSLEFLNELMREVNDSCVDPTEQLAFRTYTLCVKNLAA